MGPTARKAGVGDAIVGSAYFRCRAHLAALRGVLIRQNAALRILKLPLVGLLMILSYLVAVCFGFLLNTVSRNSQTIVRDTM